MHDDIVIQAFMEEKCERKKGKRQRSKKKEYRTPRQAEEASGEFDVIQSK